VNILKSKVGYDIVHVSHEELLKFGYVPPVCDACVVSLKSNENYYIPVMNSTYCKGCYIEWDNNSTYHKEDISYQEKKLTWVLGFLNKKGGESCLKKI